MDVIILLSLEKERNALFRSNSRKDSNKSSVINYYRKELEAKCITYTINMKQAKREKYNVKHLMTLIFLRYSWYISNPVVTTKFLFFIHIESIINIPNFITTSDNYNYYAMNLWLHHTVLISNHQKDFCRDLENICVSVMQETYTIDLNGIKSRCLFNKYSFKIFIRFKIIVLHVNKSFK